MFTFYIIVCHVYLLSCETCCRKMCEVDVAQYLEQNWPLDDDDLARTLDYRSFRYKSFRDKVVLLQSRFATTIVSVSIWHLLVKIY